MPSAARNPFQAGLFPVGRGLEEFIRDIAGADPALVLDVLVPAIVGSAKATAVGESDEGVEPDTVWSLRLLGADHNFSHALLGITERAAREQAKSAPERWRRASEDLLDTVELDTPRFLLYRAWEANPEAFAEQAIGTLLVGPDRLRCGYSGSRYWVTRQLIGACSPLCSEQHFAELEAMLTGFEPDFERRDDAEPYRGQVVWLLLSALDPSRISKSGHERLAELSERFPYNIEQLAPTGVRASFVGSPISEPQAAEMDDREWFEAIARYDSDGERTFRDEGVVGGAGEVARQFEAVTKREPDRFARLGVGLGDEVNVSYFAGILRGLASPEHDPDPGSVFDFLRRCHECRAVPAGAGSAIPCASWPRARFPRTCSRQSDGMRARIPILSEIRGRPRGARPDTGAGRFSLRGSTASVGRRR